jgi:hypothetical protein
LARKLEVEIVGDASSLQRALRGAEDGFRGTVGQFAKGAAVFNLVNKAFDGMAEIVHAGISEFTESAKVAAQTDAVIKSTGGSANVTAGHVDTLAHSVSDYSGISHNTVQVGENMLLTFRDIHNEVGKGNNIFDQATAAVTNMDEAMTHGNVTADSMSKMSILVGKALEDPVKGMTSLRRVGVALTQDQQDQVKALLDTGMTAKEVAKARVDAEKQVQQASAASATATEHVKAAQDALASASEQLRAAQEGLVGAHQREADASQTLKAAVDAVAAAKEKLRETQKTARQAQIDLTQARRDAARTLRDLKDAATDAKLSEEGATIRLQRAQENLMKVMADSTSSDLDKREALLAVKEAGQGLVEAETHTNDAVEASTEAQKKGVEGMKGVVDAKNNVVAAHKAEVQAAKGIKDAQDAVAHAYRGVQNAEQGVADAARRVAEATRVQHDDQQKLNTALGVQSKATNSLTAAHVRLEAAQKLHIRSTASTTNLLKAQKIILGELNKEFAGSAKAAGDTLPGQLAKMKNAFDEMAGGLIQTAVPALTTFAGYISSTAIPKVQELFGVIAGKAGPVIGGLGDALKTWADAIAPIVGSLLSALEDHLLPILQRLGGVFSDAITNISKVLNDHGPEIQKVFENLGTVIENLSKVILPVLKVILTDVLPAALNILIPLLATLSGILVKVSGAVDSVATALASFSKDVFNIGGTVVDSLTTAVDWVREHWPEIATLISGPFAPLVALATDAFGIRSAITGAFDGVKTEVVGKVGAVVTGIGDKFDDAFNKASVLGSKILNGAVAGVTGIGVGVWNVIDNIGSFIDTKAADIAGWGGGVANRIKGAVTSTLSGIGSDAWGVISNIGTFLDTKLEDIKGFGAKIGGSIKSGLIDALTGIGIALGHIVQRAINFLIDKWNDIHLKVPEFDTHIPGIGKIGGYTIDFPNIPHVALAGGGIVTAPTFAMLGERGREAVIPLDRAGGLGGDIHIHVAGSVVTERDLLETVRNGLIRAGRNNGTIFGGAT